MALIYVFMSLTWTNNFLTSLVIFNFSLLQEIHCPYIHRILSYRNVVLIISPPLKILVAPHFLHSQGSVALSFGLQVFDLESYGFEFKFQYLTSFMNMGSE